MAEPTSASILVVDLARVLDESAPGQAASAALKTRFEEAQARYEQLREQAKSAVGPAQKTIADEMKAFEETTLAEIEAEKTGMRDDVLEKARAIIDDERKARGAQLVIDAKAVVMCPEAIDITALVLEKLAAD